MDISLTVTNSELMLRLRRTPDQASDGLQNPSTADDGRVREDRIDTEARPTASTPKVADDRSLVAACGRAQGTQVHASSTNWSAAWSDRFGPLGATFAAQHDATMGTLCTLFHGDIPKAKRFLVVLGINNESERTVLADGLKIPRENIVFVRKSNDSLQIGRLAGEPVWGSCPQTRTNIQTIQTALTDTRGASVTLLGHYMPAGEYQKKAMFAKRAATAGGMTVEHLAEALGGAVNGGRLNLFVCFAQTFGAALAAKLENTAGVDVQTVGDEWMIEPFMAGQQTPQFYFAGPPLKVDGRGRIPHAPKQFSSELHRELSSQFISRNVPGRLQSEALQARPLPE